MKPAARIAATIELLDEIERAERPPDSILDEFFRRRRYAGSGDRRDISARVYAILRARAKLDWWINRTGTDLEVGARRRALAHAILQERQSPEEVASCFDGAKYAPDRLSDPESDLLDALYGRPMMHREMPDCVRYEYPAWMDRSFRALWSDKLVEEVSALNQLAPVDLRVNTLKSTPEQALQALQQELITCHPTPLSPIGLRIEGKVRLAGTKAFKDGLIELQDEGSQIVSILADARPGMTVVDLCAGAGGKTLALAASMAIEGKISGHLHALDISKYRLDRMLPRLRRAGAATVKMRTISAGDDPWLTDMQRRADRVVLDVPCTGTGSWRRNPFARWQFGADSLGEIQTLQRQILARGAELLKPNGRLVYITCSLLQEENEQQVAWFLGEYPEFEAIPMEAVWAETVGGPAPMHGPCLRLSPASTGTDGFFCAVIKKHS